VVILALLSLVLFAVAGAVLYQAAALPRVRHAEAISRIRRYGFARARTRGTQRDFVGILDAIAAFVGATLGRHFESFRVENAKAELVAAGKYDASPRAFIAYRLFTLVGTPLLWIYIGSSLGLGSVVFVLGLVAFGYLGWIAPLKFVQDRAKRRREDIDYELPELIDLLIVTIEAGVGFVGSLQLAASRVQGPLGQELRLTIQEQTLGLAINEALKNMMERTDTASTRSFVRSIIQGETLGVSIGQILRDLATEMRRRRRQAAEERAQKAPIKMLFPLVFLIFPAMFIVLLSPAAISIFRALRNF
jgi:tight adherence protein C